MIAIIPSIYFILKSKGVKVPEIKFNKNNIFFAIVFVIFLIHLYVYLSGSFSYPYLEDGDSWTHADVASFIGEKQTYSISAENPEILHYTEPYPPVYSGLMGLLNQVDGDLYGVLKFINSVLISLSVIFIFFFVGRLTNSAEIALFSSFLLAVMPSFLSHFIFSAAYATMLFFPALYCFSRLKDNRSWLWPTALVFSGVFIVQPIAAAMFFLLILVYLLTRLVVKKRINIIESKALIFGLILSQLYWIPTFIKFGFKAVADKLGFGMFAGGAGDSSFGVIYKITDYIIAPSASKIDQPTGWGVFMFGLLAVCIIFYLISKKDSTMRRDVWIPTMIIYTIILVFLTEGNAFPIKFVPHRLWAFLAIGVVILAAYGAHYLLNQFNDNKSAKYILLIILFVGLLFTSAAPKYAVETAMWPPGAFWNSQEELAGYLTIPGTIPENSRIMIACDTSDYKVAGLNMRGRSWDTEVLEFKKDIAGKTSSQIYEFAKSKGYEYIIFDGVCIKNDIMSEEKINSVINELQLGGQASVEINNVGMVMLKLN